MYTRILAALDGSALAEQILPHVEALAAKFGGAVILVRATTSGGHAYRDLPTVLPARDPCSTLVGEECRGSEVATTVVSA